MTAGRNEDKFCMETESVNRKKCIFNINKTIIHKNKHVKNSESPVKVRQSMEKLVCRQIPVCLFFLLVDFFFA